MSYIPGTDLQKVVDKKGRLKPEDVARIAERVLNVLMYFSDNGVVHGDVKPANIIVQEKSRVVVVDYGLTLVRPTSGTSVKGYTPMFASPEQRNNTPLLAESDLYSLGLTMIYALGGDPRSATVPSDVPDPLCKFIKRLIVHDIRNRPHWKDENLCQTISDVRLAAFGRRSSDREPLDI